MTWLFWQVPESKVKHYIIMMLLILFLLPALFGIRYTSMGYVFNFLWADFIHNPYIVKINLKIKIKG